MCIGKEENFKIIGSSHTDFALCIKESLLIHKDKPKLNISDRSMPLYLFEWPLYYDGHSFLLLFQFCIIVKYFC